VDINPAAQTLTSLYPGAKVVDARTRVVFPGFVNAHFHTESVLLRYITRRTPFGAWNALPDLQGVIARMVDPSSAAAIAMLYRVAGISQLRSGTTTVADYPARYTPAVLGDAIEALAATGIRSVVSLQTWEQVESVRSAPPGARQYSISLGPESDWTVYSLEGFVRAAADTQFPLAAHLGEMRAEIEAMRGLFKKGPLRILKDCGALTPGTHLMHCNHIGEKETDLLREAGNPVTLCVRSTLAKETGYPLLRSLASRDVAACLGTDWGETDLLGEISVLRNLRRYATGMPPYTPLELMRMATINGAHALGIASHTGSIEVGKYADLVMISLDDLRLPAPGVNPTAGEIAEIITDYCTTGMIAEVMTQGVFRVWNGEAVRVDGEEILREFRQLQGSFLPRAVEESGEENPAGIPFVASDRGEKTPLAGSGETEPESPREPGANIRPPGKTPGDSLQKFPIVTKKLGKIFGEDDI
jgi:5-methylthioadenosine/S-adenosylhomocysteine deaminase